MMSASLHLWIEDFHCGFTALSEAEYEATLVVTTGSDAHLTQLNQLAASQDIEGLGERLPDWSKNRTEADIYGQLGLPFIVPELRGDADSIEAASADKLPALIEGRAIYGAICICTPIGAMDGVHFDRW